MVLSVTTLGERRAYFSRTTRDKQNVSVDSSGDDLLTANVLHNSLFDFSSVVVVGVCSIIKAQKITWCASIYRSLHE